MAGGGLTTKGTMDGGELTAETKERERMVLRTVQEAVGGLTTEGTGDGGRVYYGGYRIRWEG